MLFDDYSIPPTSDFWQSAADRMLSDETLAGALPGARGSSRADWSALRVLVPAAAHVAPCGQALARRLPAGCPPPQVQTLSVWLATLAADGAPTPSDSERLMRLYAELRRHAWLKTLFSARRNADLLPLAQTLIGLCDELTLSLLPLMDAVPGAAEEKWQAALQAFPVRRGATGLVDLAKPAGGRRSRQRLVRAADAAGGAGARTAGMDRSL
jgi:ATP-dependent helicase/nuclease subunit B